MKAPTDADAPASNPYYPWPRLPSQPPPATATLAPRSDAELMRLGVIQGRNGPPVQITDANEAVRHRLPDHMISLPQFQGVRPLQDQGQTFNREHQRLPHEHASHYGEDPDSHSLHPSHEVAPSPMANQILSHHKRSISATEESSSAQKRHCSGPNHDSLTTQPRSGPQYNDPVSPRSPRNMFDQTNIATPHDTSGDLVPGAWPHETPPSSPMVPKTSYYSPAKTGYSPLRPMAVPKLPGPPRNDLSPPIQAPQAEQPVYPKLPDEPPLCPEQAALVDLIASGRNVFYTGSAGCGKSTVLKAFTRRLRDQGKNVRILAPTGRAALQVNGSTTWTFAGWRPDHHKRPIDQLRREAHGKFVWKRFQETDVIVIDEISMVENLHFERLNEILKEARGTDQAFGGIQIIVTGDFCQLPPVRPFQHCIECGRELIKNTFDDGTVYRCIRHGEWRDEEKWAFKSKAWGQCNFHHVHLYQIHRQSDQVFIKILQKCRMGERLLKEDTNLLMDHKCMVHHATKLFATRKEVSEVNTREFNKLSGTKLTFWTLDEFKWQQERHPHLARKAQRDPRGSRPPGPLIELSDHRFADCVELKKGMLVVLLVNLDLDAGLCNGSQGIVCGFEPYSAEKLPMARKNPRDPPPLNEVRGDFALFKAEQIKSFITDPSLTNKVWPVVRFHNGVTRVIYADCSITELGDETPYSLLVRTQLPLAPAWAMTIHKSQSLTLDRVIVNLSRAFEEGQVYVALSRATGLQGLKIEGDREGLLAGLGGNKEVQKFLRDKFGIWGGGQQGLLEPEVELD